MLKVGDWVLDNNLETAYIKAITADSSKPNIFISYHPKSQRIRWVYASDIVLLENELEDEDILAMQHLAVNTGDKNWFNELSTGLSTGIVDN